MRCFPRSGLSVAILFAAVPSFAQTISLEQRGTTLDRAAKEIAAATNVKVTADANVAKEIVAFRLRDVTLQDLLDRLADAVGAEVVTTEDGGRRFVRSDGLRRRQEDAHFARLAAEFERVREERLKGARLDAPADEPYFRAWRQRDAGLAQLDDEARYFAQSRLDAERSEARFAMRMLRGVRAEDVARIPLGEFRLFRTRPTSRQLKLDLGDPSGEIARFARERLAFAKSLPPPPVGAATEILTPAFRPSRGLVHLSLNDPIPSDLVEPLLLIGRRTEPRGYLDLRALAITREGRFVEIWSDAVHPLESLDGFRVPPPVTDLPQATARMGASEWSREFFERTRATETPSTDPISIALAGLLQRPEDTDPWAFVGDALLQLARDGDVNLVFAPLDPTYSNVVRACASDRPVADLYRSLEVGGYRTAYRDGWLAIAPQDPVEARDSFLDRGRMGEFARRVAREGYADLRSLCRVSTPIGVSRFGSPHALTEMLLGVMVRSTGIDFVWPVAPLWRRVLGELSDAQYAALDRGEAVPVLALAGRATSAADALFFGGHLSLLRTDGSGEGDECFAVESPTFAFPLALPPSLALRLDSDREEGLVAIGGSSRVRFAETRTLQGWAYAQAWRERLSEPPVAGVLRPATLVHRTFRITVGPLFGRYLTDEFVCDFARPGFTLDSLPPEIAQRYAPLLELERGRANAARVDVGRKKPPPPSGTAEPGGPQVPGRKPYHSV